MYKLMRLGLALAAVLYAQRIKAVFGLAEGDYVNYPNSGLFYRWEDVGTGIMSAGIGAVQSVEPFGTDLAYDLRTKLLFVVGGANPTTGNWRGSVYALDVWHSTVPLPTFLDSIGARRLAVWDTLLLVTRNRPPFFTAYRINYNPSTGSLLLDSLWSPTSALLRSVPEALLVWGDTAYVGLAYNPANVLDKDSLVLAINLRTRQVVGSWTTFANPAALVRVGSAIYAGCYGSYLGNLQISQIIPTVSAVTTWDAGYVSYGGFATDTGGVKDTILFWDGQDTLRAFAVTNGQTAPGAYLNIVSVTSPFTAYGVFWVGQQLWVTFTNFLDTSLIILRDPTRVPTPPYLDTMFVSMGSGGIGYPAIGRFIYVEDDTSRSVSTGISSAAGPVSLRVWPSPAVAWVSWQAPVDVEAFYLYNSEGQQVGVWRRPTGPLFVGHLPAGLYLLEARRSSGERLFQRFLKE
jgi:hypothetical protein